MQRLIRSFGYAFAGVGYGLRTQANFRIQVLIASGVILAGVVFKLSTTEWAILIVTMTIVLSAELFNTAIEAVVDRVGNETHPLSKIAKDAGAGAVLIGAVGAIIVGVLIFGPRLLALIAPGQSAP